MANALEDYIRQAAQRRGFDPEAVMRIVMGEGGVTDPTNRSRGYDASLGGQEQSYGPFQLNMHAGLGKRLFQEQGVDARDPANVYKGIDYALDRAGVEGWTPWLNTQNKLGYGKWTGLKQGYSGGLTLNSSPVTNPGSSIHPEIDPTGPSIAGVGSWAPGVARMDGPKGAEVDMGQYPPAPNASFMDNLKNAFKDPKSDLMSALTGFMGKAGGGGGEIPSTPIQSTLPSMEAADAARTQGAAQLMATLLAKKRKPMGLTLNSGMM